ncbi:aromatic ring-hydroxylating dioxygenase subunit alpha [Hydrogenophaga sp.]|uniref:aromatic ring-hydroxylating oxygenase subunit alpha n=1 Tax=Hydrogenophaga sp. TaxID=1904254 RepID=UPI00271DA9D8|nr:aromatic ring-hydroxylating dioxygenase subunit alpha [Hydrogenophaga sp.]MDO9505476.1 aromatic ring-hydroxylating dioxygenase subunit alpha [Hydrogenophaga sp.]
MEKSSIRKLIVDDHEQGVFRVRRTAFTSQEVFEREREAIFDRTWLYVGHESEVPGPNSYVTRTPGGRPIIVSRDGDGKLHAFLNACTHRGNMVARERSGTARVFTCFYHAWSFDTKGQLIGLPGEDAYTAAFDKKNMGLVPVRLESYRGMLFVTFDAETVDLVTYLGGARETIDHMLDFGGDDVEAVPGAQNYSIKANWKLLLENSMDAYHAASTHARYFREYIPAMGMDPSSWVGGGGKAFAGWRGVDLGNGHAMIEGPALPTPLDASAPEELARIRAALDDKFGKERAHKIADYNRNLFIYPNLILISFWRTVRTFYPVAPGYMEVDAWALLPRSESEHLRQKRIENFLSFLGPAGLATPDDVAALEGCQRGFQALPDRTWSDISRGMGREPLNTDELQMRAFWRRWHAMMLGEPGPTDCSDHPERVKGQRA